jgi:dipeptidyl aminopeptidase/acylaminoacyl peptidase
VAKALHGVIRGMAAALTASSPASHGDWPANRLAQDQRRFVWADREGNLTPATQKPMDYRGGFRVSHDGKWLAVEVGPGKDGNLWLLNLERDVLTQLTLHEAGRYDPVWSPDGKFVYFGSKRDGKFALVRIRSDGTAGAERLTEGAEKPQVPESVSPDGRYSSSSGAALRSDRLVRSRSSLSASPGSA